MSPYFLFTKRLVYLGSLLIGKENPRGAQTSRLLLPICRAAGLIRLTVN
jgi:hypothetical protein